MKALIVGSNSFIGKHLVKRIRQLEIEVVELHSTDDWITSIPKSLDYIFYLSAYGNHSFQTNDDDCIAANIGGVHNILELTKHIDYHAFIHFSTSSVELPIQTYYSATKHAAEHIIKAHAQKYNKPCISVRPFSVFGPGEAPFRFIPSAINAIMNNEPYTIDPKAMHDFIYVQDFIDALIYVMDRVELIKEPVDIGTGVSISNWVIFDKLQRIIGRELNKILEVNKMRPYDTDTWVADPTFITDLGWRQKHSIEEGLLETYNYYKSIFEKKNN